jgi:hypothetical protein
MKNYLLTIIGNIESEKMCKEIAQLVSPLVESPSIKYQHGQGVFLFHFATGENRIELHQYIHDILYSIADTFILSEVCDKMSVHMPEKMFNHLFDLEIMNEDTDEKFGMELDMNHVIKNFDFNEEMEDELIFTLLNERMGVTKQLSLDEILDKINTKGYKSLTTFEVDTLENYSKN